MMARKPSTASSAVRTSCPALARCTRRRSRNVRSSSMITILANRPSRTPENRRVTIVWARAGDLATTPIGLLRAPRRLTRVRGGQLGVDGEHALAKLEQVRIAHAVLDQSTHRLEEIFRRRAQLATRAHQSLDDGLERQLAGVVGVRAVDEKSHRP